MIDVVNHLVGAVIFLFQADAIFWVTTGTSIGLFFGAVPGLGGSAALALAIPFSYGMDPMDAMLLFSGIMGSIAFGGSVPAILINTPGTAVNATTCFDGYPMARQGKAGRALAISALASGSGAIFGVLVLILLIPLVRQVVMLFGPPEVFWMVVFGLLTVSFAARGNFMKGMAAGGMGILISLIGYSDVFGLKRFTLGSEYLWDGIPLIPFFVGMFAISEIIRMIFRGGVVAGEAIEVKSDVRGALRDLLANKLNFVRSSAIGTAIGIVPGVGAAVATFLSYLVALQNSKNPDLFGKGTPEGIIASEASNDAKDGGALLPTVSFGIPGSGEMAVLLGAFMLHGLAPGPELIKEHLDIVAVLIVGLVVSNIIASTLGLALSGHMARLSMLNVKYFIPFIIVFCFLGAYIWRSNIWDTALMILSGLFAHGLRKYGYSPVCLVIGFILGVMAERAFAQSLMISYGSYAVFFTRPVALIIFIIVVLVFFLPVLQGLFRRRAS